MFAQTITHESVLIVETCCSCGTPFGIEENLQHNYRKHGTTFYCPNGHQQFYGNSVDEQLKQANKELKQVKSNAEWWKNEAERTASDLETTRRSLSATKGVLTKTKKRIGNGICPCCNRQFINLQRHMNNQHPEYKKEEV